MEVLADCMQKNRTVFVQELRNVRFLDKNTFSEVESLRREENELLDELQQSVKEGLQVDEESLLARFQSISDRRAACTQRYERQAAIVQNIYDQLDGQLNYLNEKTSYVAHLFPSPEDGEERKKKNKKKRKKSDDQVLLSPESALAADPNEPVYCFCRRISFGNMVACDHPDCEIEWFHFACVNITSEPTDPWYCPNCIKKMQQ